MDRILGTDYRADRSSVPEMPGPGQYQALGIFPGRMHAIYSFLLLEPPPEPAEPAEGADKHAGVMTLRALQRPLWLEMRNWLRIVDLHAVLFPVGSFEAFQAKPTGTKKLSAPWPHLTHFVLKDMALEDPGEQMDALFECLFQMPMLVYAEFSMRPTRRQSNPKQVDIGSSDDQQQQQQQQPDPIEYPMPGFLVDAYSARLAIWETWEDFGYWPLQHLRVLSMYNMGWTRVPWALAATPLLDAGRGGGDGSGGDKPSQGIRKHKHPGLDTSLYPLPPIPEIPDWVAKREKGKKLGAPLLSSSLFVDYFYDLYVEGIRRWAIWSSSSSSSSTTRSKDQKLPLLFDAFPRLQYVGLRGSNLRPAANQQALADFTSFCMFWIERARYRSVLSTNTYMDYEKEIAFPSYNPVGTAAGQRGMDYSRGLNDLPAVTGELRPWRFLASALDFGRTSLVVPGPEALADDRMPQIRAGRLLHFLHFVYLQCLMTQGRRNLKLESDESVWNEQASSLLQFFSGTMRNGDAWRHLRINMGRGRSPRDGRGIAVFTGFPYFSFVQPITLDLMPAMLFLRGIDRVFHRSVWQRWGGGRQFRRVWYENWKLNPSGEMLTMQRASRITHLLLHGVTLSTGTEQMRPGERRIYRRLTGLGTAESKLWFHILSAFHQLTFLSIRGVEYALEDSDSRDEEEDESGQSSPGTPRISSSTPKRLLSYFRRLFEDHWYFLRIMVRVHQTYGWWPLQHLAVLQLNHMGFKKRMPWSLLPMPAPYYPPPPEIDPNWPPIRTEALRYLRRNYPIGPHRGHIGAAHTLRMELLPRLMHIDLRHNHLWSSRIMRRAEEGPSREEEEIDTFNRRLRWLGTWMNRGIVAASTSPPSVDWRGLSLHSLEARVDTRLFLWSDPQGPVDAPHLWSFSTLDMRENDLILADWTVTQLDRLVTARRAMYMSHLSRQVDGDNRIDMIQYLTRNTFEFLADERRVPYFYQQITEFIDENWGLGVYDVGSTHPLPRGICFRMDGDRGSYYLLQRLVLLSAGANLFGLLLVGKQERPEYGQDEEDPQYLEGRFGLDSPGYRSEALAHEAAAKTYAQVFENTLLQPRASRYEWRQELVVSPRQLQEDIVDWFSRVDRSRRTRRLERVVRRRLRQRQQYGS